MTQKRYNIQIFASFQARQRKWFEESNKRLDRDK